MQMEPIVTLISSVGFPIVVACAIMYYVYEFTGKLTEQITEMNTVMGHLLQVIEDNNKLLSHLDSGMEANTHE